MDDRAESGPHPARLVVLIPAHDEAANIGATLTALQRQTRRPDRVVVIADNCTDDTADIVRAHGAEVYETVGNTDKKAGALNQAIVQRFRRTADTDRRADGAPRDDRGPDRRAGSGWRAAQPVAGPSADLRDDDHVLVMDADTQLDPRFLETAAASLDSSPGTGAAGGLFYGHPGSGVLGQLQRNEYLRYSRDVARTGRVMVLTGTGTLFRVRALREVAAARGSTLPGRRGQVYDTLALTEDNELTLALKTLGWRLTSPAACSVVTEIMPTWRDLWQQRMRWQRGALENLRHYGLTRVTLRYWGQQVGIGVGVLAFQAYLVLTVLLLARDGGLHVDPFWGAVGLVFLAERLVTVRRGGRRALLLALPLVVELAYDLFVQAVFVRSLLDVLRRREATWHHVAAPATT
ncbi:cellulose synthase/poly-beta-1,6-N-acetylglucosamine synthase-like glycosyltransferase [Geodermatophilus tzadiensis]|uniref:Cellulose synthase/poly-beta-1,6-N-acetylglucosamine synthase-like glycosyltransferase n=1 Tax=Geodermatophilus tzadiensis TaxID=1137988 RepID=A0A2T0TV06_9ACTN|nr:glycosyltransferase family 2 protein [Geodermatophilus tzadiensis]PRY49358.1 cellulose synthase/poly-beta-1,6-N-acetylglucosamine synthase-like glycosyltransferase [Geodermatophilus tzadiensis]